MPLNPQMEYPWLPRKNYADPDSMLGLDPRLMPRTPGYDPSQVRAGDDTQVPGRSIQVQGGGPGGGSGGGSGGGGGIEPPPPPPPPRGIPGQSHGTPPPPPLRVPTMHQGTQQPPTGPTGTTGGGGYTTSETITPYGGGASWTELGGGPIGGGMGPSGGGGLGPVPTMSSNMGGNANAGGVGGQPPVPGNPSIPTPGLPSWVSGGGGPVGGPVGPIDGKEKNPWANGWDPDWEEGDELMARGGIVTKPTRVRLGEQGPEAVRKLRPENYEVGERPMTYLRRSGR